MSTSRFGFAAALTVVLLIGFSTTARAVVISHTGASDPETEGWELRDGSPSVVTAGAVLNDQGLGIDAWYVEDQGVGTNTGYHYNPTDAELTSTAASGWTLSTRLRVPSTSDAIDGNISVYLANWFGTSFLMEFGSDAGGNAITRLHNGVSGGTGSEEHTVGSGYHLYQLVYDPTAATADLLIDGVLRQSGYAGFAQGGETKVTFGAEQTTETGRAHYQLVQFEVGMVPEPSPYALGLLGLLAFVCNRRRFA